LTLINKTKFLNDTDFLVRMLSYVVPAANYRLDWTECFAVRWNSCVNWAAVTYGCVWRP